MSSHSQANAEVRRVIEAHARLPVGVDTLSNDADLFAAGMTSHASVTLMLGLEDAFDLEFPDHMLKREVFASVGAIERAINELAAAPVAESRGR
jgi:acyl carrier protein